MPQLTANYHTDELRCKDGCGYGDQVEDYDRGWVRFLDVRRRLLGRPSLPTSGKRCDAHNTAVGGVPGSAHTRDALDEATFNGVQRWEAVLASIFAFAVIEGLMTFAEAERVAKGLKSARCGLGIAKTFVHVDRDTVKPRPALWKY